MSWSIKSVVFAEEIRREVSNKDIIIGVFGGDIIVSSIGVDIRLALWLNLTYDGKDNTSFDLQIAAPNSSREPLNIHIEQESPTIGESSIFTPSFTVPIEQEGSIVVRFREAENDFVEVGRKMVTLSS
jgi:hypothetical protein